MTANSNIGLGVLNLGFAAASYVRYIHLKEGFHSGLLQLSDASTFDGNTYYGNGNAFIYTNKMNANIAANNIINARFDSNNALNIAYGGANYIYIVKVPSLVFPVSPEA